MGRLSTFLIATTASVCLAAAATAAAQPFPHSRTPAPRPENERGAAITFEELRERAHARFRRLDVDRDRRLTALERGMRPGGRMPAGLERRFGLDGVLTREEFHGRADARFARLDADGDGRLTIAEGSAGRRGCVHRGRALRNITLAELNDRLRARFERRDRNGDGVLTPEERRSPGFRRGRAEG